MAHGDGTKRIIQFARADRSAAEIAQLAGVNKLYVYQVLKSLQLPWKRQAQTQETACSTDDSWWGRQEPFTGRVIRNDTDQIVAREMRSGWWRIETWPGRSRFVASFDQARQETAKTGRA